MQICRKDLENQNVGVKNITLLLHKGENYSVAFTVNFMFFFRIVIIGLKVVLVSMLFIVNDLEYGFIVILPFYDAGRLVLSGVVNVFCNLLVSLVVLKV